MKPELRLDRLERVLKLAIKAGYRERLAWREQSREQTEKINAMISTHMDAMDRLDKQAVASKSEFDERMGKLAASQVKFERRMNRLAAAQEEFDERLMASREEFNEHLNMVVTSLEKFDERWIAYERRFEKQMAASRMEFDERMGKLAASMAGTDERINKLVISQDKLADEHAATERSLKALIDGLQKGQNGKPPN